MIASTSKCFCPVRPKRFTAMLYLAFGVFVGCQTTSVVAQEFLFDIDGDLDNEGPTLDGWTQVLSTFTATDLNSVSLTLSGAVIGGRDRFTLEVGCCEGEDRNGDGVGGPPVTQGIDNDDNEIPEGEYSDMYRDFVFSTPGETITATLIGLNASTLYEVTVWSYDSAAYDIRTDVIEDKRGINQDFIVNGEVLANLIYEGDIDPLPDATGVDPNTDLLADFAATFELTTDESGVAVFSTTSGPVDVQAQGARVNGIRFAIPVSGLPGDYNDDGVVDTADYTVWRDNIGSSDALSGNGDESGVSAGVVDMADYDLWKTSYGSIGAASIGGGTIPEPSSLVMSLVMPGLIVFRRTRC